MQSRARVFAAAIVLLFAASGKPHPRLDAAEQQRRVPDPTAEHVKSFKPVTDDMLLHPDPADWPNWRRTLDGWGYSPLKQITTGNVSRLRPVWGYSTGELRGHEAPPLVNNGVMFVSTPNNQVLAGGYNVGSVSEMHPIRMPDGSVGAQVVLQLNTANGRVPADSTGVEFFFTPEGRDVAPISLGRDPGHMEPTFGPDCGRTPCAKRVFSVKLGRQIKKLPEGWGHLTVRDVGTGEEGSVRVYWDATPPKAPFLSPRFNAPLRRSNKYQVIAHTLDDDVISLKVVWKLALDPGREVPLFEQHFLGFDFAQHAACVPTTVGANLQWLQDTGQADVVNPVFAGDPKGLVTALG